MELTSLAFKTPSDASTLLEIARTSGTPTYVYDERIIRRQCQLLKQHLGGINHRLLYAMKANAHPAVLEIIKSEGFGIDAVSPGEFYLAQRAGFDVSHILYTVNNITDEEMHALAREKVLLNLGELSRIERFGKAYPGSPICVRLNPQVGSGHHQHVVTAGKFTKFGIPVQEISEILRIAKVYDLRIVGAHQHIGSGIASMEVLAEAITVLMDAAQHFPDLEFVNIGGGFNIPYRPDDSPIDFENFQSAIVSGLQSHPLVHSHPNLSYWFEPGRFLTAEAGTLLVSANTIKDANGLTFAGTDSGMNQLVRPTVYGAYHEIYNLSNPEGNRKPYEIVGNICESGDVFAHDRQVQTIRENDVLAIMDAGAYGMSMASVYNLRPLPAEVMIHKDGSIQEISRRMSERELVDQMYGAYFDNR